MTPAIQRFERRLLVSAWLLAGCAVAVAELADRSGRVQPLRHQRERLRCVRSALVAPRAALRRPRRGDASIAAA